MAISGDDKVMLFVGLKGGIVVSAGRMLRHAASNWMREWWTNRMVAFDPFNKFNEVPEDKREYALKEIAGCKRWLDCTTIAVNGSGGDTVADGEETWAIAAWDVSQVVGMWTMDAPDLDGDEWKSV